MLIYPNVPTWRAPELGHALAVLGSGTAAQRRLEHLRLSIETDLPGWTAVLVASGRYALQLAVETLGLRAQRLAVPAYVCPSVATALRAAGAAIVPIDCEVGSFRFDPDQLLDAVRSRLVDGIVAANTYGFDQDFARLGPLGVPIIDDAAYQAGAVGHASRLSCGTRGGAGIWSFSFKALSGIGGGVLLLPPGVPAPAVKRPPARAQRTDLARLLDYGLRSIVQHHIPGAMPIARIRSAGAGTLVRPAWRSMRTGAMSALQAAVALGQWEQRAALSFVQDAHAAALVTELCESKAFVPVDPGGRTAGAHFVPAFVRTSINDAPAAVEYARRCLRADGVHTDTGYPLVLGSEDVFPGAAGLAARLLLLPCHAGLEEAQIGRIRKAIRRASVELARRFRLDAREPVH